MEVSTIMNPTMEQMEKFFTDVPEGYDAPERTCREIPCSDALDKEKPLS